MPNEGQKERIHSNILQILESNVRGVERKEFYLVTTVVNGELKLL